MTGSDRLEELKEVPQSSVGAPLPHMICGEQGVFLIYLAEDYSEVWDGTSVRVADGASEEPIVTIQFIEPHAHYFGPPNDEAMGGHPLAERGLSPYSCFKVHESSWISALERINSVHPYHRKESFDVMNHFIFSFHDSIFECVANAFVVLRHERSTVRKAIEGILHLVN